MGSKMTDQSVIANNFVDILRDVIRQEISELDTTLLCKVANINSNGSYDVWIEPDEQTVVHNVQSISESRIEVGDYVYVYKIRNQLNNSFIIKKVGASAPSDIATRLDDLEAQIQNISQVGTSGGGGTTEDTGATSVRIVGSGNAFTNASYSAITRAITFTKGSTFATGNDVPKWQATATIIIDALTNINGRYLSSYTETDTTIGSYTAKLIKYGEDIVTEAQAKAYMEYMTGSAFVPVWNYEKPINSIFIMNDLTAWKPQYDPVNGLVLYKLIDLPAVIISSIPSITNGDIDHLRWSAGE